MQTLNIYLWMPNPSKSFVFNSFHFPFLKIPLFLWYPISLTFFLSHNIHFIFGFHRVISAQTRWILCVQARLKESFVQVVSWHTIHELFGFFFSSNCLTFSYFYSLSCLIEKALSLLILWLLGWASCIFDWFWMSGAKAFDARVSIVWHSASSDLIWPLLYYYKFCSNF